MMTGQIPRPLAVAVIASCVAVGCKRSSSNPDLSGPSGLTAAASSFSEVDLAWTLNTTNADFVLIERAPDGFAYVQIAFVNGRSVSYADTSAAPGGPFFYRVRVQIGSPFSIQSDRSCGRLAPRGPARR